MVRACPIRGSVGSSPHISIHVVALPDQYRLPYESASLFANHVIDWENAKLIDRESDKSWPIEPRMGQAFTY